MFIWTTLVYDPIAYWTWNLNGWSAKLGGLDFAGGTPVHISSGTAALAISIYLGRRRGYGTERLAYKPHNTSYVVLGTVLLWFGWFGFNGGSAISANLRAVQACIVTNLAASVGGITWMLWDYRLEKKWSAVGFCSGAISGLVAITPGSGFVGARKCPTGRFDSITNPSSSRCCSFRLYGRYLLQFCHPTQICLRLRRHARYFRQPCCRRYRRKSTNRPVCSIECRCFRRCHVHSGRLVGP